MLCFDLTHRPSFLHLDQWMERVRQQALPGIPCLLIGCKCDEARNARQVTKEEATAWAQQHGMSFIETSAKEKENVQFAFQQITKEIFVDLKDRNGKSMAAGGKNAGRAESVKLDAQGGKRNSSGGGGCC
ncbi:putative rab1 small GTP-binding protein [Trypanosoma grayi]|uniref:putative rab1 small GTP-binding protein n=1 Tax=Trypanosoma grayi TaxID=71804 RepID=UPI0004F427C5|nr:putative rab1 small GTP-binding protein [Trypanosoma grayi]KEG10782.1 putative rab1 small GTP-binding protein [Trypanosoma grayi]